MKFKIGDRVSTREATTGDSPSGEIMTAPAGAIGTVTAVDESGEGPYPYGVQLDKYVQIHHGTWIFDEHELDHVDTDLPVEGDPVKKPSHYRQVPGIECIDVVKHFNFPVGSAIKYLWRHEHKGDPIENLRKAIENIEFEIARREAAAKG